jgi:hypothetical protein
MVVRCCGDLQDKLQDSARCVSLSVRRAGCRVEGVAMGRGSAGTPWLDATVGM